MSLQPLKTKTLTALLERCITAYPEHPALGYAGEEATSYARLGEKVRLVASYLRDNGVGPGDRVAILSENSPNWGVAYFGITSLKAIAVPILNDFHPSEIHHILRHSGASALFVSERLYHKVEEFNLESLNAVILADNLSVISPDWSKDRLRRLYAEGSREMKRIKHMALQMAGLSSMDIAEDDPASIIYTSGTTGHSKGVMLSHGNIVSNAIATEKIVPIGKNDRLLSILPLPHVYECTLGLVLPMMIGASVSYVSKPPTAAVLLPALKQVRPTIMLSVPLIIEKMFKARILPEIRRKKVLRAAYKVPAVRKLIHRKAGKKLMETFGGCLTTFCIGGASLAPDVEVFLKEAGFPYAIGYGLTETSPLAAGTGASTVRLHATGKPLPGVEIRIDHEGKADADEEESERQERAAGGKKRKSEKKSGKTKKGPLDDGEILIRGHGVMLGYFNDPELTAETVDKDGWLRTGDLGAFDKDGYLYIRGRLKNMILGPSGENIYPESIESVLHRSDYVMESLVFKQDGRLVARVYLNYEKLDEEFAAMGCSEAEVRDEIRKLLVTLRDEVNASVASFARLAEVIEQSEPFEKTPTQKIKRYLYVNKG
ncbi:AMP-binding protein [Balneolales bacterium ANBcel1]|nr:AMP-binding protein [Balneolales bacterium ANBcel1]